jgi:hypothetical protein
LPLRQGSAINARGTRVQAKEHSSMAGRKLEILVAGGVDTKDE